MNSQQYTQEYEWMVSESNVPLTGQADAYLRKVTRQSETDFANRKYTRKNQRNAGNNHDAKHPKGVK